MNACIHIYHNLIDILTPIRQEIKDWEAG